MENYKLKISEIAREFTSLAATPEKAAEYYLTAFSNISFPAVEPKNAEQTSDRPIMNEFYKKI